jgi:hypothetical protein
MRVLRSHAFTRIEAYRPAPGRGEAKAPQPGRFVHRLASVLSRPPVGPIVPTPKRMVDPDERLWCTRAAFPDDRLMSQRRAVTVGSRSNAGAAKPRLDGRFQSLLGRFGI